MMIAGSTGLLSGYPPTRTSSLDPRDWRAPLELLHAFGFDAVDLSEMWTPITELDDFAVDDLAQIAADAGLRIAGLSLIGAEFGGATRGATLDRVQRAIEHAARLGAPHVSVGLHGIPAKRVPPSKAPGYGTLTDRARTDLVSGLGEVATTAAASGVHVALELHEHSVLHSAASVLSVLDAVGSPWLLANPDLGNLLRATGPMVEEPLETIEALRGRIGYWHVKNGIRLEVGPETYRMYPSELSQGSMNYRMLLRTALAGGFDAPLVIEHYGGDVLQLARGGAEYLRTLLGELGDERLGPQR